MSNLRSWAKVGIVVVFAANGCAGSKPGTARGADKQGSRADNRARSQLAFTHFADGTSLMAAGDFEGAAAAFERSLQLDPASVETRMALAECYFNLRQLDRAVSVATGAPVKDARVYEMLARCYRYQGRDDEAVAAYRRLVALDSTDSESWWYLSRLALRAGRMEEAVQDIGHLVRLRPEPRLFNEIAELNHRLGRYGDAAAACRQSLMLDSTASNRDAWLGMAASLEPLGRYPEAAVAYRRAIDLQPDDLVARKRLVQLQIVAGETDSAIVEIRHILALRPDDPERFRLGMLWYSSKQVARAESLFVQLKDSANNYIPLLYLGRIAADRNDYSTAKDYLGRAIAVNDSIPDAWFHLGSVLLDQDSLGEALATAHRAVKATGQEKMFWHFAGTAFSRKSQYDSAVTWFDRAWRLDTTDGRVQFALAASLERAKRFVDAAKMFRSLLAREPDNPGALNYLGYMYADSGINLKESMELIKRALAKEPNNGAYLDSYGWVLYRLGRYGEAETQIRKALEVLQSDATIHDHLGDIVDKLGRHDEAQTLWRKALELDPGNPSVKRKLGL